jgi:hypothetical protein
LTKGTGQRPRVGPKNSSKEACNGVAAKRPLGIGYCKD